MELDLNPSAKGKVKAAKAETSTSSKSRKKNMEVSFKFMHMRMRLQRCTFGLIFHLQAKSKKAEALEPSFLEQLFQAEVQVRSSKHMFQNS